MYSFAAGAAYALAVWTLLYVLARNSRGIMLRAGLAFCWIGPVCEYWHRKDYWTPRYLAPISIGDWVFGIEDLILSFAFAGFCAGIFDLFARRTTGRRIEARRLSGILTLVLVGLGYSGVASILVKVFGFHSYHAVITASLLSAFIVLLLRPRWVPAAVLTSVVLGITVWVSYWGFFLRFFPGIIDNWWNVDFLVGLAVAGVPAEEVLWGMASGLSVGPIVWYCVDKHGASVERDRPLLHNHGG